MELEGDYSTGVWDGFWEAGDWQSEIWSGIDTVDRGCWGFWAQKARISVDILGLGS